MITDACVPLSRLSDLITVTREALDASWLPAPIIAHAGTVRYSTVLVKRSESLPSSLFFSFLILFHYPLSLPSYIANLLLFLCYHRLPAYL